MARAANTVAAVELDDIYETLTDEGKEHFDGIGRMGYRPYKTEDNLWFARPLQGTGGEIGPAGSVEELAGLVADYVTSVNVSETVLDADKDGNTYLPGAEEVLKEVDIPELRQPALDYHAYKTERINALGREVEAKEVLDHLMHKHEAKLPMDPETKIKYFKVGSPDGRGRAVIIDLMKGSDKIKSRVIDEGADIEE